MNKINEMLDTIKRNLFTNDGKWRERSEENEQLAHKIREQIAMDTTIKNIDIVKTLDFLEDKNI